MNFFNCKEMFYLLLAEFSTKPDDSIGPIESAIVEAFVMGEGLVCCLIYDLILDYL